MKKRQRTAWLGGALLLLAWPCLAGAQNTAPEEPLYPEMLLDTDFGFSDDAGLADFRARLAAATKVLVETPEGKAYDPLATLPLMASSVEVLVGKRYPRALPPEEGWPADVAGFRSRGSMAPLDALEAVGRWREADAPSALVAQRYGMRVIDQLLWEQVIGATPWLGGRICTASYGRLSDDDFAALVSRTGISANRWIVSGPASEGEPPSNFYDPFRRKSFQLVPRSMITRRDGGWTAVLTPDGATVQIRNWPWAPRFAPYLNNHLCFEHQADGWKLVAIALRLE